MKINKDLIISGTSTTLEDLTNKKIDVIQLGRTAEQVVPANTTATLEWDTTLYKSGEGLTLVNNGVKIGSGIKKVEVTLMCPSGNWVENQLGIARIVKNGSAVFATGVTTPAVKWCNITLNIPNLFIDVKEGDVITATLQNGNSSNWTTRNTAIFQVKGYYS